jgi:hypothetical protein
MNFWTFGVFAFLSFSLTLVFGECAFPPVSLGPAGDLNVYDKKNLNKCPTNLKVRGTLLNRASKSPALRGQLGARNRALPHAAARQRRGAAACGAEAPRSMASMLKRGLTAALHAPRAVSEMGQGSGAAAQHAGEDGQGYSAAAAAAAAEGKRRPPELALGGQAHSAEEAGESVPSHSARSSSRKWHETGIDSKRTLHVLANPMDGLMGIQTEIPNPAHPSARSDGSWRDSIKDGVKQRVGKGMGSRSSQSSASGTRTGSSASDDDEQGTRKDVRTVCFFIPWPEYDDLPDLPRTNWLKMSRHHAVRRQCANIALHPRIENFWVCVSVLHFLLAIPEFERNVFGCIVDAKTSERCAARLHPTALCS